VYDMALRPVGGGVQVISTEFPPTSGMRFVPVSQRAFIQCGVKQADNSVLNKNMTLGGLGATYATNLGIAFGQIFFDNNLAWPQVGIGVGANPTSFSGANAWKGVVAGRGPNNSEPFVVVAPNSLTTGAPALEFHTALFGNGSSGGRRLISLE